MCLYPTSAPYIFQGLVTCRSFTGACTLLDRVNVAFNNTVFNKTTHDFGSRIFGWNRLFQVNCLLEYKIVIIQIRWKNLNQLPQTLKPLRRLNENSKKNEFGRREPKRTREKIPFHYVITEGIFSFSLAQDTTVRTVLFSSIL